jgi:hypothetical protein
MNKKKEKVIEFTPDDMFYSGDKVEILRLFKVAVASHDDMESIYHLYKKYVKANAPRYKINCTCPTSIGAYYQKLLDWYSENGSNFK